MESNTRVVITGIGLVSPAGQGTKETWSSVVNGESGIGPITLFDSDPHPVRIAGEVSDFDPSEHISPKELKRMDRFIQFALVAALDAVADAGLEVPVANPGRVGVLVGVGRRLQVPLLCRDSRPALQGRRPLRHPRPPRERIE